MKKEIASNYFRVDNGKISHFVLGSENNCFIIGYQSIWNNAPHNNFMLMCSQDILNDLLIKIDEPTGELIKVIVNNVLQTENGKDIFINVADVLHKQHLSIKNLIIFGEHFTEERIDEQGDVLKGFIEEIILKEELNPKP